MKKYLIVAIMLCSCAYPKDLFKANYSDFDIMKLMPLNNAEYAYEMNKMCQSKYKIRGKEEICADFYYYWDVKKEKKNK